ncbi:hypothetical protein TNCV_415501 [Trichonephila clavipes]|nr:hypothetical protein TNCV_415501 [Trichonephila clavipes]
MLVSDAFFNRYLDSSNRGLPLLGSYLLPEHLNRKKYLTFFQQVLPGVKWGSSSHLAGNKVLTRWGTSPLCTRRAKLSGYKISEPMD